MRGIEAFTGGLSRREMKGAGFRKIKKFSFQPGVVRLRRTAGTRAGFTLLEIIVVVFILSLLVAIVAPKIIGRTDDARIAGAKVQIRNFETALKLFKMDNGFYPDTQQGLDALVEKPSSGMSPQKYREGGYLEQKKIPLDPWGNQYIYVSPGIHGDFDIISYGADGKEGGTGKDEDIKSWDIK